MKDPVLLLLALTLPLAAAAGEPPAPLTFQGKAYLHRWSHGSQHEFTPRGEEDLQAWTNMITVIAVDGPSTGEQLAELANKVVERYKATGTILRTDSTPATKERPAEHFAAVMFGQPTFLEAAFARIRLVDGGAVIVVYGRRIYGNAAGGAMSGWLEKNAVATETALRTWTGIPTIASLKALPQSPAVGSP
jgi:hypothetical protein